MSRLADDLWGSREDEAVPIGISPPADDLWEPRSDGAPDPRRTPPEPVGNDTGLLPAPQAGPVEPVAGIVTAEDLAGLRSALEEAVATGLATVEAHVADALDTLSRQVADLTTRVDAPAAPDQSVGRTELQALRTELEATFAGRLDQVRSDLARAVAGAELRLHGRLDALAPTSPEAAGAPALTPVRSRTAAAGILPLVAGVDLERAEPATGDLQSQVDALQAQLAWARSQIETTVAATEAVAVAAEARLRQQLEFIAEQARSEASPATAVNRSSTVRPKPAKAAAKKRARPKE